MCARTTPGSPRRWRSTSSRRCSRPYASGVHLRGAVAAAAGMCAAATAHVLDETGRLPFVHESLNVRTAMSPAQVVVWLIAAAVMSALAVTTRVLLVGVPGALLVSAAPELIGRGDPGAIAEPGAILGALLQVLLLLAVVALALVLERRLGIFRPHPLSRPAHEALPVALDRRVHLLVAGRAAPRAPPLCVQSMT